MWGRLNIFLTNVIKDFIKNKFKYTTLRGTFRKTRNIQLSQDKNEALLVNTETGRGSAELYLRSYNVLPTPKKKKKIQKRSFVNPHCRSQEFLSVYIFGDERQVIAELLKSHSGSPNQNSV